MLTQIDTIFRLHILILSAGPPALEKPEPPTSIAITKDE
jgi:hypothetical protein